MKHTHNKRGKHTHTHTTRIASSISTVSPTKTTSAAAEQKNLKPHEAGDGKKYELPLNGRVIN